MTERRFRCLQEALILQGVAAKHAARARLEIENHYRQLVDEAVAHGAPPDEAARHAHSLLGSDQVLIDRFASQGELRAWSVRWTRLYFALAPLLSFLAVSAITMCILCVTLAQTAPYLHQIRIGIEATRRVDLSAQLIFLWLFPLLVAGGFAALAYRQRIALRWPMAGIMTICGLAALINVHVILTGGAAPGYANAGVGLSSGSLPSRGARALVTATLVLYPLWRATRRLRRDRPMTN